jgi:opacity protein-like surface antigen
MRLIGIAVLSGIAGLVASTAMAADAPGSLLPPAPVLEADTFESWYLRGDVGYVHAKRPEADFTAAPFSGGMVHESIGDTAMVGIGIGYQLSPMLRADVTLDHRFGSTFKGTLPDAGVPLSDKARFQSSTLMFNGYVDLALTEGITPYVGAGIGIARTTLGDYTRMMNADTQERLAGGDDVSFAWALMGGIGYQLSSGITFDLGYRYLSLGDVKTRGYENGSGADIASIGAHEVRLGVRYAFQ